MASGLCIVSSLCVHHNTCIQYLCYICNRSNRLTQNIKVFFVILEYLTTHIVDPDLTLFLKIAQIKIQTNRFVCSVKKNTVDEKNERYSELCHTSVIGQS